jgi:hypothetical protein
VISVMNLWMLDDRWSDLLGKHNGTKSLLTTFSDAIIHTYIYISVCVCVCVTLLSSWLQTSVFLSLDL